MDVSNASETQSPMTLLARAEPVSRERVPRRFGVTSVAMWDRVRDARDLL